MQNACMLLIQRVCRVLEARRMRQQPRRQLLHVFSLPARQRVMAHEFLRVQKVRIHQTRKQHANKKAAGKALRPSDELDRRRSLQPFPCPCIQKIGTGRNALAQSGAQGSFFAEARAIAIVEQTASSVVQPFLLPVNPIQRERLCRFPISFAHLQNAECILPAGCQFS